MVDELRDRGARMHQNAGHGWPVKRIGHEEDGNDRQRPADGPAGCLQKNQDKDAAKNYVRRRWIADPEGQIIKWNEGDMHYGDHGADGECPVEERNAQRPDQARMGGLVIAFAGERKDQEDEAEHEGKVDASVQNFRQQSKTGCVIVEDG